MESSGKRHSILIPQIVVVESARSFLPLAIACTLLDLESSGGLNVFGSPTKCGPNRFTEVTEKNYNEYKLNRSKCGAQGVGPLQLTWPPYQDEADREGGCWNPEVNCRVGFRVFSNLWSGLGERDSFSMWNTGRVGVTPYSDKALALLPSWKRVVESSLVPNSVSK